MTRFAAVALSFTLLTACQSYGNAAGRCAHDDKRAWKRMDEAPVNAESLRALAYDDKYFSWERNNAEERWFSLRTGEILLCRSAQPLSMQDNFVESWIFSGQIENAKILDRHAILTTVN